MSNEYYDHGSFPATGSALSSAAMRAELEAIEQGLDKLPALTGNANKAVVVNPSGTGLTTSTDAADHAARTDNPHGVTKVQVGLGNVDNTSDATKNSAVATLTNKTLTNPVINSPTGITKSDVGLGNVNNTSDANKPVSTATQTALDAKVTGPATTTDNTIARYDGATGKVIQSSSATLDDSGNLNAAGATFTGYVYATQYEARGTEPAIQWNETDGPVDRKFWRWNLTGGTYSLQVVNDAYTTVVMTPIGFDTSGNVGFVGNVSAIGYNFSGANYLIGVQSVGDAGTFGFTNTNGPGIITWGSSTPGAGKLQFNTGGAERLGISSSGNATFSGAIGVGGSNPIAGVGLTAVNGQGVAFRTTGDVFTGGSAGAFSFKAGDGNLYHDNYDGNINFRRAGFATTLTLSAAGNATFGGNVTVGGGTLGYGAGSGGTVTQATSKSTAVTLNKPSGYIVMDSAALAAGATAVFTVNNSVVVVPDGVVLGLVGGIADPSSYRVELRNSYAGAFVVRVTNISGGSLSEAVIINFNVIKGSTT